RSARGDVRLERAGDRPSGVHPGRHGEGSDPVGYGEAPGSPGDRDDMSGDFELPPPCAAIADDLTELALGTLSGPRRSEVLEHVGSCQRCRTELDQLAMVVESVQQLAPRVQPPLGFESRVVEKMQAIATPRPRRRRRVTVLSAVAAAVALLAFGLGTLIAPEAGDRQESARSQVVRADFMAGAEVM